MTDLQYKCSRAFKVLISIMIFYLICSFSSAAMTIGENGNNSAAFVPDSNLVSQLVIWLVILQAAIPTMSNNHKRKEQINMQEYQQ